MFQNPESNGNPVEMTYKFPKIEGAIISKMTISVGDDRVIEAKVMEKDKADEKYDDTVAAGHSVVKLKENKESYEMYEMALGNIQPGQVCTVNLHLLKPLAIQGGLYDFQLPTSYFPDLKGQSKDDVVKCSV